MNKPTRPTVAEIDLRAIAFNLGQIRARVGKHVKVMAVVKANAYGHGLVEVSKFVERRFVDYFGVAFPEEGAQLRRAGVRKPIHVFALGTKSQTELYFANNLEPTICSFEDAELLNKAAARRKKSIQVHLKVDTGMNRIGANVQGLNVLLRSIAPLRRVEIKGIFTHFANADEQDKTFARRQLQKFHEALELMKSHHVDPELSHCANSAAIIDLPDAYFSMVRPGIMMYGYCPSTQSAMKVLLKPSMTLKTQVALVKRIAPGESVSYGRRFVAQAPTTIATLPIGYADGYTRMLTGKAEVLLHSQRFPVAGTICMDQLMVDAGDTEIRVGDEAVLIGEQGGQKITAWDLAQSLGTIPYEICCAVSARVPRIHLN